MHNKEKYRGTWVAQLVKHLPSDQVMIPWSSDGALLGLPAQRGVCFSLSLSLCPSPKLMLSCFLSLSLKGINKNLKKREKNTHRRL